MSAPDVLVLDLSIENHEELVEVLSEDQLEYAKRTYGEDPGYAIYRRINS
jgi:hypothetical protein